MNLKNFYEEESSNLISKLFLKSTRYKVYKKFLFLDRDGVLIKDVGYIDSIMKVALCPNVINFLDQAKSKGFKIIIVTNQSSVSRKIITYKKYLNITEKFLTLLPIHLLPDLILSNFHLPKNINNEANFNWRKPGTGMFDYAFKLSNCLPKNCLMIGDKLTDLIPAHKIGIEKLIYIKSELHHKKETKLINEWSFKNKIKVKTVNQLFNSLI